MRVYLDSSPVIYAVENVAGLAQIVDRRLSAAGVVRVASDLTRLECRVKPIRDGDGELLLDYDEFFAAGVDEVVPLSREVVDLAAEIRARHGFKTPDALHLAAAVLSRCEVFLTNDRPLTRFGEIAVELISVPNADDESIER